MFKLRDNVTLDDLNQFGFINVYKKQNENGATKYLYRIPYETHFLIAVRKDENSGWGNYAFPHIIFANTDFESDKKDKQLDIFFEMVSAGLIERVEREMVEYYNKRGCQINE